MDMRNRLKIIVGSIGLLVAPLVNATDLNDVKNKFESLLPFTVSEVKQSPVSNFYQIESPRGIFYSSKDGKYIFSGSLHKFEDGLTNLTALRLQELSIAKLAKIENKLITFPAKNEKFQVTVFTDPSCGYCRKLHTEMDQYNELGITIKYAAFPRGGVDSPMATTLKRIWCSPTKNEAMNAAKTDTAFSSTTSCENPVNEMYELGNSLGINGTPALVFKDGSMTPGYMPPAQLLVKLKEQQ